MTVIALDVGMGMLVGGNVAVTNASAVGCAAIDGVDAQPANKITDKNKKISRFILSPKQAVG
jgi:hypothetical protein